jgi:hypothetical protein
MDCGVRMCQQPDLLAIQATGPTAQYHRACCGAGHAPPAYTYSIASICGICYACLCCPWQENASVTASNSNRWVTCTALPSPASRQLHNVQHQTHVSGGSCFSTVRTSPQTRMQKQLNRRNQCSRRAQYCTRHPADVIGQYSMNRVADRNSEDPADAAIDHCHPLLDKVGY